MPRKVSGTTNDASKVLVIDETTWEVEQTENITTGNFEAGGLEAGNKIIVGRRNTDGEIVGYGNVPTIYDDLYGRTIGNAMRLDGADYLERTLSTPTSSQKGIVSLWFKVTPAMSLTKDMFMCQYTNTTNLCRIGIEEEKIYMYQVEGGTTEINVGALSGEVFRDYTGWMHFVFAVDSTDPTQANRLKMWINNRELVLTSYTFNQNIDIRMFTGSLIQYLGLGHSTAGAGWPYDGYMAEYIYLDGETDSDPPALFGEERYGIWVPKTSLAGLTYGDNGFKLDFSNSSGIGDDTSGNYNNYSTYGTPVQVTDTPTNDFSTANLNDGDQTSFNTYSLGNTKIVSNQAANHPWRGTQLLQSGKWYWEVYAGQRITNGSEVGILKESDTETRLFYNVGYYQGGYSYNSTGTMYHASSGSGGYSTWTTGDTISIALDLDNGKIFFAKNGVWENSGVPVSGTGFIYENIEGSYLPAGCDYTVNNWMSVNFGNPSHSITSGNSDDNGYGNFEYAPPTGFLAPCSANMDEPAGAIEQSDKGYYVNTREGTGASASVTDVDFDVSAGALVIIKNVDQADEWKVLDTERGATKELSSDSSSIESTDANGLTAFTSTGYTLGTGANGYNDNSETFLDIVLRKGSSYGLDIVKYVGNESASQTINHNLGAVPKMMWVKDRDNGAYSWPVYHVYSASSPEDYNFHLNTNATAADDATVWYDTAPTSTQFTVGSAYRVNQGSHNYIAYLFTDIPGYCKAFTYTGNGNNDGPFIPLGFRPKFWFLKSISTATAWSVFDTVRDPYNPAYRTLGFDRPDAEFGSSSYPIDALAQGLKIRTTYANYNQNAVHYVGFAWAEQLGKWSNAR